MIEVDDVVIGTGPGGNHIALQCGKAGHRVAIVDHREPGGTCALRGCNPKKVLANAARLSAMTTDAKGTLLQRTAPMQDWSKLHEYQNEFTQPVPELRLHDYNEHGIHYFQQPIRFLDSHTLELSDTKLKANRIVIATGAIPVALEFPGAEMLSDSEDFLNWKELPESLVIVGGGYIGVEFGFFASQAGCKVTIVDRTRLLDGFDPDLVQKWSDYATGPTLKIITQDDVAFVEEVHDGLSIRLVSGITLKCDRAVGAAGRRPSIDNLGLEQAGVMFTKDGVVVDDQCRTSAKNIWAVGDCAAHGAPDLTPVAEMQASLVADNWCSNGSRVFDRKGISQTVFCYPSLAMIGKLEDELVEQRVPYKKICGDFSEKGSIRKLGKPIASGYKFLLDASGEVFLGAHLLGPEASEQINLLSVVMRHNLTRTQFLDTPLAYPTFGSDLKRMVGEDFDTSPHP